MAGSVAGDFSSSLRSVGERDEAFPIRHGRGDGVTHPAAPDPRKEPGAGPGGRPVRDIYIPLCRDRHKGIYADRETMPSIVPKTRDFR